MKKLTPDEFFEMIDIYYDKESKKLVFDAKDTDFIYKAKNFIINSERYNVINSKGLVFLNSGDFYHDSSSVDEYTKQLHDDYIKNMEELNEKVINVCSECETKEGDYKNLGFNHW